MYIRLAATDGVAEAWPRKVACLDLGTGFHTAVIPLTAVATGYSENSNDIREVALYFFIGTL